MEILQIGVAGPSESKRDALTLGILSLLAGIGLAVFCAWWLIEAGENASDRLRVS